MWIASPRRRLVIGGVLALGLVTFGACSACGRKDSPPPAVSVASAASDAAPPPPPPRPPVLWASAADGDVEDLAKLAVHEGAAGLVEAAGDPTLRKTAIRAMAYARGWAQLPFLARAARGDEVEAALALDAAIELAARPRKSEDVEDATELKEGCEELAKLAGEAERPRARRIAALRALRMMPCPKLALPSDLDAK